MIAKLGTASLNQTPLDWKGNQERIRSVLKDAVDLKVQFLCLPELCISGYGVEDGFFFPGIESKSMEVLLELLPETKGLAVTFGMPLRVDEKLYNAVALVVDGVLQGFVLKQFLANYGLHYETRWFTPWPAGKVGEYVVGGKTYPVGDLLFEVGSVRVGIEICHDAWVDERPLIRQGKAGVGLVLNPSASHFAFSKYAFVRDLVCKSTTKFACTYLYSNLVGNEAGRIVYDGAGFIATQGEIVSESKRFSYLQTNLQTAVVDLSEIVRPAGSDEFSGKIIASSLPDIAFSEKASAFKEQSLLSKEEEFTQAVCLGLFDYLRKSGAKGYVVSLSGGADSSSTAVLIAYMLDYALQVYTLEELVEILLGPDEKLKSVSQLRKKILTCVYQATTSSSKRTRDAASVVAEEIEARFVLLELDEIVEAYKSVVGEAISWTPDWTTDDIALQNIQARTRGPSAWLIANLSNSILLATSNRSEAAVGYATMDGDTCGGLSPISGIDKAFLRRWLVWAEKDGPSGLRPVPSLSKVNSQEPTAELRPGGEQTDEADLMPYEVLDMIERLSIRDRLVPLQVFNALKEKKLQKVNKSWTPKQLAIWVERFFVLWSRNQWKRERYAPGFHLDDENLDPKTWCRFPILSGGFEKEIEELRSSVG